MINKKAIHGWTFSQIIVWILIFVVGSLIVTFLVSPNSFDNFISNIKTLGGSPQDDNFIEVSYPPLLLAGRPSCAAMEVAAQANGIGKTEIKQQECTIWCGQKDLEYHHYECITDKLHCYCKVQELNIFPKGNSQMFTNNSFGGGCITKFNNEGITDLQNTQEIKNENDAIAWLNKNMPTTGLTSSQRQSNIDYFIQHKLADIDYPIIMTNGKKAISGSMNEYGEYICTGEGVI